MEDKQINLNDTVSMELTFEEIGILRSAIFREMEHQKKEASRYYQSLKRFSDDKHYKKWYENHSDMFFRVDQLRETFQDQFTEKTGVSSYEIEIYKNK